MNYRPLIKVLVIAVTVFTACFVVNDINNSCELSYDANGGTCDIDPVRINKGDTVIISDIVPEMKGFAFSGWSKDRFAETGTIMPGSEIKVDDGVTLYAIWSPVGDIVVLSDAGLDDAIALCQLFENIDLFDSVTVLAVGGNGTESQCLTNIRKVVELCGVQDRVTIVSTASIPQNNGDSSLIHGSDMLGDLYHFTPTVQYKGYCDWIGTVDDIDWLISLGGCTVTKMILASKDVGNFLLMGGFIRCDPFYGDYEFNQMMDPDAYSACVRHDHKDVTIDTGTCEGLDVEGWVAIGDGPIDRFFKYYQQACIDAGDASIAIWDDIAITYLLHPHHFTYEKVTDPHGNPVTNLVFIADRYNCGIEHTYRSD